jgi:hypothetical protein
MALAVNDRVGRGEMAAPAAHEGRAFMRPVPRQAPPTPRRIVRMGRIEDNGDSPTWTRPKDLDAPESRTGQAGGFTISDDDDGAYDIPAFLRKQAE